MAEEAEINKGLTLTVDLECDVPEFVKTDPTRVRQVLFNLVSNALKFTEEGGICVRVSSKRITGYRPLSFGADLSGTLQPGTLLSIIQLNR